MPASEKCHEKEQEEHDDDDGCTGRSLWCATTTLSMVGGWLARWFVRWMDGGRKLSLSLRFWRPQRHNNCWCYSCSYSSQCTCRGNFNIHPNRTNDDDDAAPKYYLPMAQLSLCIYVCELLLLPLLCCCKLLFRTTHEEHWVIP